MRILPSACAVALLLNVAACGGGDGEPVPPAPVAYSIGGTVSGLSGAGLVLQNNGAGNLAVPANGPFTFATGVTAGNAYNVTVATQPSSPAQTCAVANGSGTTSSINIASVAVSCTVNTYVVSGTVTGATGSGLVLRNGTGSSVAVPAGATTFSFPAQVDGSAYAITVQSHPAAPTQLCGVASGAGTLAGANVGTVAVTCTTSRFVLSGTVSGVLGTGLVLQNNGSGALPVMGNSFAFAPADSGSTYSVTVVVQPSMPAQNCVVTNATGILTSTNVTNVSLSCMKLDNAPPTVGAVAPLDTTNGINLTSVVTADFSEPLAATTVTAASFTLAAADGASIPGTVTLGNNNQRAIFTPSAPLQFDATYTATLTTSIQDMSINALAATHTWTFNTGHRVVVGRYHSCARLTGVDNGKVKCWGGNQYGQLGHGNTADIGDAPGEMGSANPVVDFGAGRSVVQLAAGDSHTCARLDNGALKCWGRNDMGQLGVGDTSDRGEAPGEMGDALPGVNLGADVVLQVSTGIAHTCVRTAAGAIRCWGSNQYAQVGRKTSAASVPFYSTPGAVVDIDVNLAVDLAGAGNHSCANIRYPNTNVYNVACWGDNRLGQLDAGDTDVRGDDLHPSVYGVLLPGLTIKSLSAGEDHGCFLTNLNPMCAGSNWFGQMGKGTSNSQSDCVQADACIGDDPNEIVATVPVLVPIEPSVEIATGAHHSCIRTRAGAVKCWGGNAFGELGQGDTGSRGDAPNELGASLPAIDLGAGTTVIEVSTGRNHVCATLNSGAIKCWGNNERGNLGIGDTNHRGDAAGEMGNTLSPVDLTL